MNDDSNVSSNPNDKLNAIKHSISVIESPNLIMKFIDPKIDDLSSYLSWMKDSESNVFIQDSDKSYNLERLLKYVGEKNQKPDCIFLGIYFRLNNDHIGNIKFEPINLENGSTWLGILLGDSQYAGKGYAGEAIRFASKFLNEKHGIQDFYLGVNLENDRAIRVYQKLGFSIYSRVQSENSVTMHLSLATTT